MQITGNTFIVTGGASGLGEATVKEIVKRGGNVAIFDLNGEGAAELAKSLGSNVLAVGKVDITSEEDVRLAIEKTVARFGNIAGVVNCGGVAGAAKIARRGSSANTMSMDLFDFIVRVNLLGTFNVCRQVAQTMANQEKTYTEDGERGVIINTASVAFQDGQAGQTAYSASKGGVASMTLPMARDLAPAGIRVMSIAPGLFETNMTANTPPKAKAKILKDAIFPDRMGHASEYAMLACHLIENTMMSGEIVRIDGASRLGKL
ncbi:3-hydroxyacyl-dehydrogenase [Lichtheimia corymbifera JMRC:FSU:9682]|uniref:3-hydroxyacyl-dehydrogenase n=1 Tax=Lichtheimia corymbifera JMRC:FSU:9682 TaxID=1263082 RepID=A0A068RXY4_9FUNG|nr:3-hydroxyacyl-dehydrogenase [Lichtheimia corymbifera JMRC:FSU:9682]